MLKEILETLKSHRDDRTEVEVPNKVPNKIPNKLRVAHPDYPEIVWDVLSLISHNPRSTSAEIGEKLGISDRMVRKHIATLRNAGIIERIGGNKVGYWNVISEMEE